MACRFEVTLAGEDARHVPAARQALDAVDAIEDALTVYRESELVRLNRRAGREAAALSGELASLLELCRELHAATEGAFDPTATPLTRCWGFDRRRPRLPAEPEIAAARALVDFGAVRLAEDRRSVRFARPGVELSFGSIGKGWALDRVAAGLRRRGVARCLLSAGASSLLALGDGGFVVDVRPGRLPRPVARLRLSDVALGTSGAGEQYFEADGRRFGHVLDPRSGWPCRGVLSASVAAPRAAVADALATAFLIGGPALAERYCAGHPGVLALLTPEDQPERLLVYGSNAGVEVEAA
jgi:thiamine biosynthesis lipoprotein